ncbi:propionyl-CoA synthetase [Thalassotalea agarivorans]|uniref:Propionyl-CoA synthetase n=1 Tax=Thalassotalea agarivorans TaxID=349064 RepID=A0A1I0GQH0_THASX|nr:propionyl-CoA synthetase [Thalassotalea agarivorans]SET72418.1 propionyl-CoA synthetase [Thalassotalea agarivorans]
MSYAEHYQHSIAKPEEFWQQNSQRIDWFESPKQILSQDQSGFYRWYEGGMLNTSYLALDYHINHGRGEQTALIYDSPVTNTKRRYSYVELKHLVAKFADVLAKKGIAKGDRVLIYMPMIPEAAIAMLATARLGAVHSVVFGGFAPHELAVRIDDAKPKVIVTASCGIEVSKLIPYKPLVDKAIEESVNKPESCIVFQRDMHISELIVGRDFNWQELMSEATEHPPVPVNATDPLYVLYTSGTTGTPKGVMRDNGGHAVAMHYSMEAVYGMRPGEVFWAASDVGWVVGHSYIVYAPLIYGCTTVLYEGKPVMTPDAGAFWRVCEEYKVTALFSAPTAFRAIRKEDPDATLMEGYDLTSLKRLYLAGERLDPATYHWLQETTKRPVIDHWWQTETGWAIAGNPVGIEPIATKAGSAGKPTPGYHIEILSPEGQPMPPGEEGCIAIKLPLPPGTLPTIWNNPERFKAGYLNTFPGYYITGDGGYIDEQGYVHIMGRTDDIINIAGHRLSTGEMEQVVAHNHLVVECAVVGIKCPIKGQVPLALVVVKDGIDFEKANLTSALKQDIRHKIGAIASLKQVLIVPRLPKTRSGKILRKVMRQMADGEQYVVPSTIDEPDTIDALDVQFKQELEAII